MSRSIIKLWAAGMACVVLGACASALPVATNRLGMQMVLIPAGEFAVGNEASVPEMAKLYPAYELKRLQDLTDETPGHL